MKINQKGKTKCSYCEPYGLSGKKFLKIDIYNTDKKYDIIYTDPAWKQTKGNKRKCRPNQGKELDYQTCTLDEIKEIHRVATELCNEKQNIFMWTIDKYLHESEQMMKELGYELHARMIWDVLQFKWDTQKSSLHPCQKPLEACGYFIKTYTNEGDLIVDSCMGSNTTGLACKNLKRRYIGIEKDPQYYEIAKKRMEI